MHYPFVCPAPPASRKINAFILELTGKLPSPPRGGEGNFPVSSNQNILCLAGEASIQRDILGPSLRVCSSPPGGEEQTLSEGPLPVIVKAMLAKRSLEAAFTNTGNLNTTTSS